MINEKQLVEHARTISSGIWYSGPQLSTLWAVSNEHRRNLIPHLTKRDMIRRKGQTSKVLYRLRPESDWKIKNMATYTRPIEKTGNGVIDAKLRKEAGLPATTSSLENLISAATELGTDNEILRNKLVRIRAILEEV